MKSIEYKGFLIEDCEGLRFISFSKCPKIQITNLSDCDSQMLYAENLEEAKEIINNITTNKRRIKKIKLLSRQSKKIVGFSSMRLIEQIKL